MDQFKNILVCLDLTDMDEVLVKYANYLAETFNLDKITFIHVMEYYDIPEELTATFPDLDKPLDEIVKEEIDEKIEDFFEQKHAVKFEVVLESGSTTEKIIQYCRKKKVDLTLLGKKIGYSGAGGVTRKIIGLVPSTVLLVSETSPHKTEKIMVRMDFTNTSAIALKTGQTLAKDIGAELICHHVYKLPLNYFPQNAPNKIKKLKKQLGEWVEKEYQKFLKKEKLKADVPITYSMDLHGEEAQILYSQAIRNNVDLILIGTRLKSQLANIILDSTSEKLTGTDKNIPVMVVKDRKQSIGFLKALFD